MRWMIVTAVLCLAACDLPPGQPLVSGASPATTQSLNIEPQSPNSLPPNAAGLAGGGPNRFAPNYLGTTFRAF